MKKILMLMLAAVLAVSLASCNIIINQPSTDTATDTDTPDTYTDTTYPHSDMTLAPADEIVARTDNQEVKVSTFRYCFMQQFTSFVNQYYMSLSYLGLDMNIPLHDQKAYGEEDVTWYDYFLGIAKDAFEQYIKFAEMAIKEGISLDDSDYAQIEAYLDDIADEAESVSMSFEEYAEEYWGEGATRERMRESLQTVQLGYKYYLKLYSRPEFSDGQIEEKYKSSAGEYSLVDINETVIKASYDETDTEEEKNAIIAQTKQNAEKMLQLIADGYTFEDAYYEATQTDRPDEAVSMSVTGMEKSTLDRYAFLYEDGVKEKDVNVTYDEAGNAYVVQCVKPPYKNTTRLVSVRHILLTSTKYSTEEEAYAKAQELAEQIKGADDPKSEFIKLVAEYSEDPGSSTSGGLYENVQPGQMVQEFNDWCFDPERQEGDIGIVKTTYGYHIMYFEKRDNELWYAQCDAALRDAAFAENADQIYNSVTVTYAEEYLDKIVK